MKPSGANQAVSSGFDFIKRKNRQSHNLAQKIWLFWGCCFFFPTSLKRLFVSALNQHPLPSALLLSTKQPTSTYLLTFLIVQNALSGCYLKHCGSSLTLGTVGPHALQLLHFTATVPCLARWCNLAQPPQDAHTGARSIEQICLSLKIP